MRLLLAIIFVLSLSASVFAVPDSQLIGHYSVLLDINANYQPKIAQPIENEEVNAYRMELIVDNSALAIIDIAEFTELQDATLKTRRNLMGLSMLREGLNVTNVEDTTIDGKDGFVAASMPFEATNTATTETYRAEYWLDSQRCACGPVSVGQISVTITSTLSQDVTESLLNSLHVVKGQLTSTASKSFPMKPDTSQSETNKDVF
jgi:hypothetical protein